MKTLKIESNDVYTAIKMWVTIHSIYINDEFIGKSSCIKSKIDESGIDLAQVNVNDEHTKSVISDTYRSEFIVSRYAS